MSTKLLTIGSVVLINLLLMPSLYAGVSKSETPPSPAVSQTEHALPNPPVIDQTLQSIRSDEIEKAAATEAQAKIEIPVELANASQPVYPKP